MASTEEATRERAVVTVLGSDRSGIVAAVAGALARHDVNILDISQTILQGVFTMTMIVDLAPSDASFQDVAGELGRPGRPDHLPARGRLQLHVPPLGVLAAARA